MKRIYLTFILAASMLFSLSSCFSGCTQSEYEVSFAIGSEIVAKLTTTQEEQTIADVVTSADLDELTYRENQIIYIKDNITCNDWYSDQEFTQKVDYNKVLEESVVLYGAYIDEVNQCDISYFIGDEVVKVTKINKGAVLTNAEYESSYYVIEGWYLDKNLQMEYSFDKNVYSNLKLYAKYTTKIISRIVPTLRANEGEQLVDNQLYRYQDIKKEQLELLVEFNDGTKINELASNIDVVVDTSEFNNEICGKTNISITYEQVTANLEIEIIERLIVKMEVSKNASLDFFDIINEKAIKLDIIYNYGDKECISVENARSLNFVVENENKGGIIEYNVKYEEIVCTFEVKIHPETQTGINYELRTGGVYYVAGITDPDIKYVNIPSEYKGKPVTGIAKEAFKNSQIMQIKLPNSIDTIGIEAFSECRSLVKIIYEPKESGVYIDEKAFYNCIALESIDFISEVSGSKIANGTFHGCRLITSVTLPNAITEIGENAFQGCSSLQKINLSKIETVNSLAFEGCTKLYHIDFEGITNYGDSAFANSGLKEIIVSKEITKLGEGVFKGCAVEAISVNLLGCSLGKLFGNVIPLSLVVVRFKQMFEGCLGELLNVEILSSENVNGLTIGQLFTLSENEKTYAAVQGKEENTYYLPKSLTSVSLGNVVEYGYANMVYLKEAHVVLKNALMPAYLFSGCKALEKVLIDNKTFEIGASADNKTFEIGASAFEGCTSLNDVDVEGAEKIGVSAFEGCTSLDKATFSELVEIGDRAFKGTGFKKLTLPASVMTIGEEAFANTLISTFEIPGSLKMLDSTAFNGCTNLEEFVSNSNVYFSENDMLYKYNENSEINDYTLVKVPSKSANNPSINHYTTVFDVNAFVDTEQTKIRMDLYEVDITTVLNALKDTSIKTIALSKALIGRYSEEKFKEEGIDLEFDNILISKPVAFLINADGDFIEAVQSDKIEISKYIIGTDSEKIVFMKDQDPIKYTLEGKYIVLNIEEDSIIKISSEEKFTLTIQNYPDETGENFIEKKIELNALAVIDYITPEMNNWNFVNYTAVSKPELGLPKTMPFEDLTIKMVWRGKEFSVSFDTNGGIDGIQPMIFEYDSNLLLPTPIKEGYEFIGWKTNGQSVPERMPAENLKLIANWKIRSYSIRVIFPNEFSIEPIKYEYGAKIEEIEIKEDEDHKFIGYFMDPYYSEEFDLENMPAKDIVLYAKYDVLSVNLTSTVFNSQFIVNYSMDGGSICEASEMTLEISQNDTGFEVLIAGNTITLKNVSGLVNSTNNTIFIYATYNDSKSEVVAVSLPEGYYIASEADFMKLYKNEYTTYYLAKDLTVKMSSNYLNTQKFTKKLYGNGYTLTVKPLSQSTFNVDVDKENTSGLLFGINSGSISDLKVICDGIISYSKTDGVQNNHKGTYSVKSGGLVGYNEGTITNVQFGNSNKYIKTVCDRNNSSFGGIAGQNYGKITYCTTYINGYSTGDFGGIAGQNYYQINNCKSYGTIDIFMSQNNGGKSLRSWGGIVGYAATKSSVTSSCYADIKFSFVGYNSMYHNTYWAWFQTHHKNCETNPRVGAIIGSMTTVSTVNNNTFSSRTNKLNITCSLCKGSNGLKSAFTAYSGQVGLLLS